MQILLLHIFVPPHLPAACKPWTERHLQDGEMDRDAPLRAGTPTPTCRAPMFLLRSISIFALPLQIPLFFVWQPVDFRALTKFLLS